MATEILINDGGAPARILPFVASETITAGYAVSIDSSGEAALAKSGDAVFAAVGYALTTITSGNIVSVITGHGVVLNVLCDNQNAGVGMMLSNTDGTLTIATNAAAATNCQATTLENNDLSTQTLTKVITH